MSNNISQVNEGLQVFGGNIVEENIMESKKLGHYYSFQPETMKDKVTLFNALNNPNKRIEDCINMEIKVKHILVEQVEIIEERTGEMIVAPRIVLLDDKNESYTCVSLGMFSALKRTFQIFGEPSEWKKAITFRVVQKATRNGNNKVLTLELIG